MIFIISILIIIFFHEFGHLLIAKLCKCPVSIFSIGFGKSIYSKKIGETYYQITPWLLGGYIKLQDELTLNNNPNTFPNLKYRYKFFIGIAGCSINIIIGLIAWYYGIHLKNYNITYFGIISLWMGIINILPIPALDGGLIVYLPLFIKIFGQEKGLKIYRNIGKFFFVLIMILNILYLPYLIYLLSKGGL